VSLGGSGASPYHFEDSLSDVASRPVRRRFLEPKRTGPSRKFKTAGRSREDDDEYEDDLSFIIAKVLPGLRAMPTLAWKDGYA
jgi:hypothetical protein